MPDIKITCKDCNTPFTFTEGEQGYYQQKGFNQPMRCKSCREAKKARNEQYENADRQKSYRK